jgi:hypothetical protein
MGTKVKENIMKRPVTLLSIVAAAACAASMATPAALAGNEIVKCVDAGGHVTLTDQPCDAGSATVRLSGETPLPQRHVVAPADLRHAGWRRPHAVRPATLSRDVATLKAARRMLMLQEARPRLAGLN